MAKSGLIQGTVSQNSSHFRSYIYWQVTNTEADRIANNRSLIRLIPLVDTNSTSYQWNGSVSNLSNTIGTSTKNNYGTFTSDTTGGYTYSASTSPTGRAAQNIMSALSPSYYEVYVNHASDGTLTNLSLACSFSLPSGTYGPGNVSISGSVTVDTIPRQATIINADNFNDLDNPLLAYSNPAGNNVTTLQACISLDGSDADIAYRDISKTGTSYTFNLTEQERNILRNATPNDSRSVYFYIKTVISSNTFYDRVSRTFTVVNGNYVKINDAWKKAVSYVKINGTWKKAIPYVKANDTWKKGRY